MPTILFPAVGNTRHDRNLVYACHNYVAYVPQPGHTILHWCLCVKTTRPSITKPNLAHHNVKENINTCSICLGGTIHNPLFSNDFRKSFAIHLRKPKLCKTLFQLQSTSKLHHNDPANPKFALGGQYITHYFQMLSGNHSQMIWGNQVFAKHYFNYIPQANYITMTLQIPSLVILWLTTHRIQTCFSSLTKHYKITLLFANNYSFVPKWHFNLLNMTWQTKVKMCQNDIPNDIAKCPSHCHCHCHTVTVTVP